MYLNIKLYIFWKFPNRSCLGISTSIIIQNNHKLPRFLNGTVNESNYVTRNDTDFRDNRIKDKRKYSTIVWHKTEQMWHASRKVNDFLRQHVGDCRVIKCRFTFKWPWYLFPWPHTYGFFLLAGHQVKDECEKCSTHQRTERCVKEKCQKYLKNISWLYNDCNRAMPQLFEQWKTA